MRFVAQVANEISIFYLRWNAQLVQLVSDRRMRWWLRPHPSRCHGSNVHPMVKAECGRIHYLASTCLWASRNYLVLSNRKSSTYTFHMHRHFISDFLPLYSYLKIKIPNKNKVPIKLRNRKLHFLWRYVLSRWHYFGNWHQYQVNVSMLLSCKAFLILNWRYCVLVLPAKSFKKSAVFTYCVKLFLNVFRSPYICVTFYHAKLQPTSTLDFFHWKSD